jgi:hypothetical protein
VLKFYQLPESPEDVQNLWSPNDLHSLLGTSSSPYTQQAPKKNVETLILRVVERLSELQSRRVLTDPDVSATSETLICLRILTRLLPYIYEAEYLNEWEDKFFWRARKPASTVDAQTKQIRYYDGLNHKKVLLEENKDIELGRPLGEVLIDLLFNYLFFPGFTLPPKEDEKGLPATQPSFTVWQSGIGSKNAPGMTKEREGNAIEVLRLLTVLSSRAMYIPSSKFPHH